MSAYSRIGLLLFVAAQAACANVPAPVADTGTCKMERAAEMPVRVVAGGILVPGHINQIAVQMMLDTGASASMLDEAVARRLSLPSDPHRRTTLIGVGGTTLSQNTLVRSFEVGGQEWESVSIPTGHLARKFDETPPVAGLLGADRLGSFDVELDIPHGRMTLWNVEHCAGNFVPWDVPHYIIPLQRHNPNRMVARVEVGGHEVNALVDWGANATTMSETAAADIGVVPEMLATDRSGVSWGVDQNQLRVRYHRFDEVRIGRELFHHLIISVSDLQLQEAGMALGADYARGRRIWLSYATRQMFVVPPKLANDAKPH
jgi:predicted aspartyl protease